MNRNILITFTMMIIALIGLGVASAADNGTVNDVEINDIDDVVVVDDTVDSIDDVDDVVSDDEIPIIEEDDHISNQTEVGPDENDVITKQTVPVVENSQKTRNYELISFYFLGTFDKHNEMDIIHLVPIINSLGEMYSAGQSCKEIGELTNMTADEVQTLIDKYYFDPLGGDHFSYSVYKLYGTLTLEEMANQLGVDKKQVFQKVIFIKSGFLGKTYKDLFLCRDMHSLNENHPELVIGDLHIDCIDWTLFA